MPRGPGRTGHRWRVLCTQVYREETHCWLCRRWVDQTLPHNDPQARSVDHVVELWQGGDPLDRANCRLAHRGCNSIKSNHLRALGIARPQQLSVDVATL